MREGKFGPRNSIPALRSRNSSELLAEFREEVQEDWDAVVEDRYLRLYTLATRLDLCS